MATSKTTEILVNDSVIKKEKRKLMKIFEKAVKEVGDDGKKRFTDKGIMLEGLIDEAAFVRSVLLEAKRLIKTDGIETTTINGSQKYKNATPIYAEYLRTYTPLVNSLLEHIPEKKEKKQARLAALLIDD